MKKNKQLQHMVKKLVSISFKDEKIVESQVVRSIRLLKSLPKSEAIQALQEYLKGIKRQEREHTLVIETATPLSSKQIKKAKEIIEKKVRIFKVKVCINPEILGGFKLTVGDNIWDGSLLGSIYQIKEVVSHGGSGE
ncbi:F0F1 ATP synthase subunit delta [Patescibacteria group bacterium]|nr:F0F1 ATP synthase subunit delta [Patescibacteria group bacterium]